MATKMDQSLEKKGRPFDALLRDGIKIILFVHFHHQATSTIMQRESFS